MSKCEKCVIKKYNSLNELTKDELIKASYSKTYHSVKKGEIIFNEGEHVNGVYCIRSGVCKVSKMSDNGREQIIHLINKGDLLGERSLINGEAANLKATAINDMEVCFIPREEIINDLYSNPKFSMSVLKNMASALKNSDNTIVNMGQKSVKQRLAYTLLYLKNRFKTNNNDNKVIDINLSREEIASIVGTATETIIRLLSDFKKKDLIGLKGKNISILDEKKLKLVIEGVQV